MSKRNELTVNEAVVVDDWIKIAARGLTPNHLGHEVRIGDTVGLLWKYEHFDQTTVAAVSLAGRLDLHTFDLKHLDEIAVKH